MSFLLSDRNIKDKWLRNYIQEMKNNQERKEYEVRLSNIYFAFYYKLKKYNFYLIKKNKKINEEIIQNRKINEELDNEKLEKRMKKEFIKRDNMCELDKYFHKKKEEEKKDTYEKLTDVDKLTLPIKHEETLEKHKEYMNKLTEKIDKNVGIFKHYQNINKGGNYNQENKSYNFKEDLYTENNLSINKDLYLVFFKKIFHKKLLFIEKAGN